MEGVCAVRLRGRGVTDKVGVRLHTHRAARMCTEPVSPVLSVTSDVFMVRQTVKRLKKVFSRVHGRKSNRLI